MGGRQNIKVGERGESARQREGEKPMMGKVCTTQAENERKIKGNI